MMLFMQHLNSNISSISSGSSIHLCRFKCGYNQLVSLSRHVSTIAGVKPIATLIAPLIGTANTSDITNEALYEVDVKGWVRSVRSHKSVTFVEIGDGSTSQPLQIVVDASNDAIATSGLSNGSCVHFTGSLHANQSAKCGVELHPTRPFNIVAPCSLNSYPLQKKRHTLEFLRTIPHVRSRSNTLSSVWRARNAASASIHSHLQGDGFIQIHTPVITTNDCEGAGEAFIVDAPNHPNFFGSENSIENVSKKNKNKNKKEDMVIEKEGAVDSSIPRVPAHLTVSGQLHLEVLSSAFSRVYSFGSTFRAENSHTMRHLAEFYMVEAEMAFTTSLEDVMDVSERLLRTVINDVTANCPGDMELFYRHVDPSLEQRLSWVRNRSEKLPRISYTSAVKALEDNASSMPDGIRPPKWGQDLSTKHERFLCEDLYEGTPLFITDYPTSIKPFYMRLNPDNEYGQSTVAAMDLLVPGVGELFGGSLREERGDILRRRLNEMSSSTAENLEWYAQLNDFGTGPRGGFGMGFERLVLYVSGISNIRDAIPFPRHAGNCSL